MKEIDDLEISTETERRHLLLHGFTLARRAWPVMVFAYAVNLIFALLAGVPFTRGLAPVLDHSLAAQAIAGTLDLNTLGELLLRLRDAYFAPMVFSVAFWLNLLEAVVMFVLFAGAMAVFVSGEPPLVSTVARAGLIYWRRFLLAALLVACVAIPVLGILLVAREALLAHLAGAYSGGTMFVWASASAGLIFLVGLLLRLWFDLVEAFLVRAAPAGGSPVLGSLLPAARLLGHHFRIFGCFLLVGTAGVAALGLCLLLWKALPANMVWLAALLGQLGLVLMLVSRFWQRGLAAALVLSAAMPVLVPVEVAVIVVPELAVPVEEPVAEQEPVVVAQTIANPTISELVQKLQKEPWVRPALMPEPDPVLERHAAKYPLGGGPVPNDEKPKP